MQFTVFRENGVIILQRRVSLYRTEALSHLSQDVFIHGG